MLSSGIPLVILELDTLWKFLIMDKTLKEYGKMIIIPNVLRGLTEFTIDGGVDVCRYHSR